MGGDSNITHAIAELTNRVIAYRIYNYGERNMPLEIKGLKGKALKAGGVFDRLNRAYDKLIETGDAHATDVEGLPSQIEGMADDLTFMVQTLGNSINGSGSDDKKDGAKPPEPPKTESTTTPASPDQDGWHAKRLALPLAPVDQPAPPQGNQRAFDRMG